MNLAFILCEELYKCQRMLSTITLAFRLGGLHLAGSQIVLHILLSLLQ